MQSRLSEVWSSQTFQVEDTDEFEEFIYDNKGPFGNHPDGHEPTIDPDASKPRASVAHYNAIVCDEVAFNLEEKHPRLYQTDAEIHNAT